MFTHLNNNKAIVDQIWYNIIYNWDNLIRNENGEIMYGEEWKQCSNNILRVQDFDSRAYTNFYDYYYAINLIDEYPYSEIPMAEAMVSMRYSLKDSMDHEKYKYVSSAIKSEYRKNWNYYDRVFIAAGTGKGKNTFIKKQLLKSTNKNIVIFVNRDSLLKQQTIDMINEINPEALKYNDIRQSEDSMYIFGRKGTVPNIMIITYQAVAIKCLHNDPMLLNFCMNAGYFIYDEIHYILDDSMFNKGISIFADNFLRINRSFHAIKVFMSGTMEEAFLLLQEYHAFDRTFLLEQYEDIIEGEKNLEEDPTSYKQNDNGVYVLSLPTDYSYIDSYCYTTYDDIVAAIMKSAPEEKWLIFVNSINTGNDLRNQVILSGLNKDDVVFLNADNHQSGVEKDVYDKLISNSKFEQRVLIATTVIYNGINIKDDRMKHIVLPFTTIPITKQLIGRKRINTDQNEMVSVYFPNIDNKEIMKRFRNCIEKEYKDIKNTNYNDLVAKSEIQLNGLSKESPSKYYFVARDFNNTLQVFENIPPQRKLYFDTLYYIYLLHRIASDDAEENKGKYASIMLQQLGVNDGIVHEGDMQIDSIDSEEVTEEIKTTIIKDVTIVSSDKICKDARKKLIEYLDSIKDKTIVSNEQSHDDYLRLKTILNDTYKAYHGDNMHIHWKNYKKAYPKDTIEKFFAEISVPYKIDCHFSNDEGTIVVTKSE